MHARTLTRFLLQQVLRNAGAGASSLVHADCFLNAALLMALLVQEAALL